MIHVKCIYRMVNLQYSSSVQTIVWEIFNSIHFMISWMKTRGFLHEFNSEVSHVKKIFCFTEAKHAMADDNG